MRPFKNKFKHAISRSVPLFNAGQPEACAAIYETAILSLLHLPDSNLGPEENKNFREALKSQASEPAPVEHAWILRRAINQFLEGRTKDK